MQNKKRNLSKFQNHALPFCESAKGYSAHLISFLLHEMQQRGCSTTQALAGCEIDPHLIAEGATRISVLQILQAARNSMVLTPNIAFDVGRHLGVMACGIYGCGMITCPDRENMIGFIERFAPFIDPFTAVTYRSKNTCFSWQLEPYFAEDPEDPLYVFSIELKLASSLRVGRDLYGDAFSFEHVRVVFDNPHGSSYYSDLLHCPVYFNQDINEIVYTTDALALRRISSPDLITFKQVVRLCEKEAQAVRRTETLSQEVARILRNHPGKLLGLDQVASILAVNPWTLRRKLKNEGNTFSDISSEVRMDMAKNYLKRNALSIEEIAEMLGYSDASSFSKAFQVWAGLYPNQFRKSQKDAY